MLEEGRGVPFAGCEKHPTSTQFLAPKQANSRDTSIALADSIINPEAPLALRLSGQLLLGVVKVHSKKVGYLFQDCNDALVKIKQVGPWLGLHILPAILDARPRMHQHVCP